jgi:hypothetical protein
VNRLLLMLLLAGCYNVGEYRLPDGGLAPHAGDGCSCADVEQQIVDGSRVIIECLPNPEYLCDARTGTYPDGGTCAQASTCFGQRCCVWVDGKP